MKKVVVGSGNAMKMETTMEAFAIAFPNETFEFIPCKAESGVPDQPFGEEETRQGAMNRAEACQKEIPDADFYVGLEGGLDTIDDHLWALAWMCVVNREGKVSFGRAGSFRVPSEVQKLIHEGKELSHAADIALAHLDPKNNGSVIGALTDGAIKRKDYYRDAVVFALIPFTKPELYPSV